MTRAVSVVVDVRVRQGSLTSCSTAPTRCMANEPSRLDSMATRRLRSALSCSAEALAS